MAFCDKKCEIKLEKEKVERKELELLFKEYQYAWECCNQGGNLTEMGYCSYEWQNKVSNITKFESSGRFRIIRA